MSAPGEKPDNVEAATLVFLDPPYRKNLVPTTLRALADGGWLAKGCVCVTESEEEAPALLLPGFTTDVSRPYGSTRIDILVYSG